MICIKLSITRRKLGRAHRLSYLNSVYMAVDRKIYTPSVVVILPNLLQISVNWERNWPMLINLIQRHIVDTKELN